MAIRVLRLVAPWLAAAAIFALVEGDILGPWGHRVHAVLMSIGLLCGAILAIGYLRREVTGFREGWRGGQTTPPTR